MPSVFFYGSFINREVLERAEFVPAEVEAGCLWGFDIRIEPTATIVPADGCCVYGIICQASHAELSRLYDQEWLGAYRPEAVTVATREGRLVPALTYIAPRHKLAPASDDYLDRIIGPARDLQFPGWYLDRLERFRHSPARTGRPTRRRAPTSLPGPAKARTQAI
jgi:hypothetical protein